MDHPSGSATVQPHEAIAQRREDWPERLGALVERARGRAFRWGEHDCVLFAAEAVAAVTGVDLAAGVRGTYRGAAGAARAMRLRGARDVGGPAAAVLGDAMAPALARRGDVAMIETEWGPALGVVLGAEVAFPGMAGLAFVPLGACGCAWAVGWRDDAVRLEPTGSDSCDARTRFPSPLPLPQGERGIVRA
jgi:uncharacterized protein DUF6950